MPSLRMRHVYPNVLKEIEDHCEWCDEWRPLFECDWCGRYFCGRHLYDLDEEGLQLCPSCHKEAIQEGLQ